MKLNFPSLKKGIIQLFIVSLPKVPEFWCFFSNTKLLIFGNFYFIIGKSLNSFDKSIRKVKSIFIYSHGYVYEKNNEHEGVIAFDYDNKINEQKLDKSSFSKIDNNIF